MAATGSLRASRTWSWKDSRSAGVIDRQASTLGTVGSGTGGAGFLLAGVVTSGAYHLRNRRAPGGQTARMRRSRAWFHERRRPPRE
jgi:hypothetical protein